MNSATAKENTLEPLLWEIHRRQQQRKHLNDTDYPHVRKARERRKDLARSQAQLPLNLEI